MTVKLLAIAASIRADSVNKKLLAIVVAQAKAIGAEVTVMDYAACDMPVYHNDGAQPFPANAAMLSAALRVHDGVILCSPEYNWSMPGHLKNIIDWLSIDSSAPLKSKHALLLCASPSVRGGILGLNQLSLPLNHLGMYVYPHLVAIGDAVTQLTADGIANAKDKKFLAECVTDFVRVANSTKR